MSDPFQDSEDFQVLLGINLVIIQASSGVPMYERIFNDMEMDGTLISGFSSALSSMFDGLTSSITGFQSFEARQMQITIHKLKKSAMLIISQDKLTLSLKDQFSNSHLALEARYDEEFVRANSGFSNLPSSGVEEIFAQHGLKLLLLEDIQVNNEKLQTVLDRDTLDKDMKQQLSIVKSFLSDHPEKTFKIHDLVDHLNTHRVHKLNQARVVYFSLSNDVFVID